MDTQNPSLLFAAAKRFDRTSPFPELVGDAEADAIVKGLRRVDCLQGTLYVGSGDQLASHRPSLMNNNRATVICLDILDHWLFNFPEVSRILTDFMMLKPKNPAMLISHSVCWTNQAIDLLVGLKPHHPQIVIPFTAHPHGAEVPLRFASYSPRKISVRTDQIRWVRPDGREEAPLLTVAKRRDTYDSTNTTFVSSSYRESISSSMAGWQDDPSVVVGGQFPALKDLSLGLARSTGGDLKALLPPHKNGQPTDQGQPALKPSDRVVDPRGVTDVFLLKAWRLFKRRESGPSGQVKMDELVFAFSPEGRMAYIAVACQPYEGWPDDSKWGQQLRSWVNRNQPRGKLR